MSADVLRQAAALMRERAESATEEWWLAAEFAHVAPLMGKADAQHIASWHPAVALAVANWLDDAAENLDMQALGGPLRKQWDMRVHIAGDNALTVARVYLGESA